MERLKEVAHVTQGVIDKGSDLWKCKIYLSINTSPISAKISTFDLILMFLLIFSNRNETKLLGNNSMKFKKYNTFIGMSVIKVGFNGKNILLGKNIKDLQQIQK